jgi:hypothetical protein
VESPSSTPPAVAAHPPALSAGHSPDLILPSSTAMETLPPGIPIVVVSKSAIALDGEAPLVPLPSDRTHGVDATYKGSDPNDLEIPSLVAAMPARVHNVPGDLAFAFDATTPYRLVAEVFFNAGQSSVSTFHVLVSHEDGSVADLRTMAPQAHPPPDLNPRPSLGFTVSGSEHGIQPRSEPAVSRRHHLERPTHGVTQQAPEKGPTKARAQARGPVPGVFEVGHMYRTGIDDGLFLTPSRVDAKRCLLRHSSPLRNHREAEAGWACEVVECAAPARDLGATFEFVRRPSHREEPLAHVTFVRRLFTQRTLLSGLIEPRELALRINRRRARESSRRSPPIDGVSRSRGERAA